MFSTKSSAQVKRPVTALGVVGRVLAAASLWAAVPARSLAQDYTFTTFAGVSGAPGSDNGNGSANGKPLFNNPGGLVVDSSGNTFVADTSNHSIRKITPAGVVTTFAGTSNLAGNTDGTGSAARFSGPQGAAIDSSGNIYVADFGSHTIRKITPAGVVTTLAGSAGVAGSANGTGTAASFNNPTTIAVDGSGTLYVADTTNNLIRKITTAGVVTTLAGSPTLVAGSADGTSSAALFHAPHGVAIDSTGNLFVADSGNNTIRKIITATGEVSTIAGQADTFGSTDGAPGTNARFDFPDSLAVDASGNLYVTDDANNTIRKLTPTGGTPVSYAVTTLAGSAGNAGFLDATGTAAKFNHPGGIFIDSSGTLYVADYSNNLIRKISAAGVVTTLAGVAGTAGNLDGTGYSSSSASMFNGPSATATDSVGNVYVADTNNQMIRMITPSGQATTLAGRALNFNTTDGQGSAARFNNPTGLAVDATGTVFVADSGNQTVRKITPGGLVSTYSGLAGISGKEFYVSTSTIAVYNLPSSVAVDSAGNVYVADYDNHNIRRIDPAGGVIIFAGTGAAGSADGTGTAASFNHPRGLAINGTILYVADSGNHVIRKVSLAGAAVTTFAGTAGVAGSANGTGPAAQFNFPCGIAADAAGVVYVTDTNNQTIRAISPGAVVTTLAGSPGLVGTADGTGSSVRFNQPTGISVYGGILYVADYRNNTIRQGVRASSGPGPAPGPTGGTTPTGNGQISRPGGITVDALGNLFVADTANNSIKEILLDGTVAVFAGSRTGAAGSTDGTGTAALFNGPTGITADTAGNLYVSDTKNAMIRMITSAGVVRTLAGSASGRGNQDGTGSAATFQSPAGIAFDNAGNLYVADSYTSTIRKITATGGATSPGVVTTLAGKAMTTGDTDATGADARFHNPTGVALDGSGYLYVADTYNNTIRKITLADNTTATPTIPAGTVTTIAGSAGISGSYDGLGDLALFNGPTGLHATTTGIVVADTGNNLIRVIGGTRVTTSAGIAGISGYRDGAASVALFDHPEAVTIITSGSIVVADTGNSSLRNINGGSVFGIILKAPTTTTPIPTTPTPTSGGGSLNGWFVGSMALLLALARASRRRRE